VKSGIGITLLVPLIMPEMYDRLDPENPASKWDFSRFSPDVGSDQLLQNDHGCEMPIMSNSKRNRKDATHR